MKIWKGEQRTDEWHHWRNKGVGASESAGILGMSKYKNKTPYAIWEDKTKRSFGVAMNADMQRGIDLEDEARRCFEKIIGITFTPVCAGHDECLVIRASFDGISESKKMFVEIKCPRGEKLCDAIDTGDISLIRDLFPDYWVQCQHQHCVFEDAEKGYLVAYQDGNVHYMEIPRDDAFIKQTLFPGIKAFWNYHVCTDEAPPLSDKDYLYIEDAEAIEIAQAFIDIAEQRKSLQEQEKQLKQSLANYGDDGSFIVGNVLKMTRYNRESTNYKQACEDYDIDLSKYKKESIGSYRITPIK